MIQRETYIIGSRNRFFTRIYHSKPMDEPLETVVLVHGSGLSGENMHLLAMELQKDYLVLVPDLPGFGYSSNIPHVMNIPELGESLYDWIVSAHVDKAWFIGHSTGCQVIADLAFYYPQHVKGIILQGLIADPPSAETNVRLLKFIRSSSVESTLSIRTNPKKQKKIKKIVEFSTLYRTKDVLPMINLPALVVHGLKDEIVPQDWSLQAAQLLPKGVFMMVPQATHAMPWTTPKHLAALTHEFIKKTKVEHYERTIL
jgi:2-hydroxy-6-oxonona-2,4-dienedioate hydrolase